MSTEDHAKITLRVLLYIICLVFIKWAHTRVVTSTITFCHISYQKVFSRLHFNLDTKVYIEICTFFLTIQYHSHIMWNQDKLITHLKKQLNIEKSNCYLKIFLYGAAIIELNKVSLDLLAQLTRDLSLQNNNLTVYSMYPFGPILILRNQ